MRRAYGQGAGPTRAKTLRQNRRWAQAVSTEDERDIGIRPGVSVVLGLCDEPPMVWVDGYPVPQHLVLQTLAHRWFTKGPA